MARIRYRSVWISDTHLGSKGCQAEALGRFLKRIDCQTLYLVGDIVDFWRLRKSPRWPSDHNDVVRRLLKLVKRGTKVVLVPGNHDEVLRQYDGTEFGGILICREAVHRCLDGRHLLVTHGDQFDLVVKHSRLAGHLGAAAYEWLLVANRMYNHVRRWRGLPYWSLSQFLKLRVKSACEYLSRYRETLLHEAATRGLDGVICGHIHQPEVDLESPQYFNCGDWVENCTALVEHFDGALELIDGKHLVDADDHVDTDLDDAHDHEFDAAVKTVPGFLATALS